MVYEYVINGLSVKTGDLLCTADGSGDDIRGQFWRLLGKLIPGDVDHVVVYVGPEGRCVEAGARGKVITFEISGGRWDYKKMLDQRGIVDELFGVAYPIEKREIGPEQETSIRERVAAYCLRQAALQRPYNVNFLDSETEEAFYCSQLAYRAYQGCGIDLNTGIGVPAIPGTESIIFPQEIWSGCVNRRP
jgi:hypothetical protein